MNCPKCTSEIAKENINVMTDIAQCQQCGHLFKISENLFSTIKDGFDIKSPPSGAWYRHARQEIVIGATTRSPIAFFMVPFMLVWSGGSLGGIYGSQILSGHFNLHTSLFGIPFILGSIVFWSLTLMCIWGKTEITVDRMGGKVFTGIGSLGWTKHFKWENIDRVIENQSNVKYPGSQGSQIILEGKNRLTLALGVSDNRRYYLFRAINDLFEKAKSHKNFI